MKLILLFLSLFVFSVFAITSPAETLDKVIIIVNSEPITQNELNQQISIAKDQMAASKMTVPNDAVLRKKVLGRLIDMKLQLQLAKKLNIVVSDQDVNKAIAGIAAKNHLSVDQLKSAIEQHNMNYGNYKKQIKDEMTLSHVVQTQLIPSIKLSEPELEQLKEKLIKNNTKGDIDKKTRIMLLQKKYPEAMQNWLEQLRSQAYVKTINN